MNEIQEMRDHDRFIELCALATSGTLNSQEIKELDQHLAECPECRQVYAQFHHVANEGMPLLAPDYEFNKDIAAWDDSRVRGKLFDKKYPAEEASSLLRWRAILGANVGLAWAPIACCLLIFVATLSYRLGRRAEAQIPATTIAISRQDSTLSAEKQQLQLQAQAQISQIQSLESLGRQKQLDIERLEQQVKASDREIGDLTSTNAQDSNQIQSITSERDTLSRQLEAAQQAYRTVQDQLSTMKAQYNQNLLHVASLESDVRDLSARVHEQEGVIADRDQFLSSDRDIRELMGARQLYIADVFDVDNSGRAQKPFGRVFYTKNKSLIFYAFDLDQQAHLTNASTFQVWGERSFGHGKPVNLGMLYMDSETNRRWVLRFDDPKSLAEIDAVFVTVEPHGGSAKPTGKQLLYASLRKAPNHP